jgi:hypothetical protein
MSKKQSLKPTEGFDSAQARPIVRANLNRHVVTSPAFVSIYANDTQLQTTPWDMRFTFGEISVEPSDDDTTKVTVKTTAEIRMSPQHAKRVAIILVQQIKAYEANFGPIPQPKDD